MQLKASEKIKLTTAACPVSKVIASLHTAWTTASAQHDTMSRQ